MSCVVNKLFLNVSVNIYLASVAFSFMYIFFVGPKEQTRSEECVVDVQR